jgi:DsbC/DsbD-like thiol-disulfide interchange protein
MIRYRLGLFAVAVLAFACSAQLDAGDKTKSESKVKVTAEASKIDKDGMQTVTITLAIEKGWHLYANPVNHDFLEGAQTRVKVAAKSKVSEVRVKYPAGKVHVEKTGNYDVYEGVVKIEVSLKRAAGDTAPLAISIDVQACDSSVCLKESTIKLMAP